MLMNLVTMLLLKPGHHGGAPPPDHGGEGVAAAAAIGVMLVVGIIGMVLLAIMLASMWKVFTKANQPGWMAIVPILNLITLLNIVGKPVWWVALYLIPGVSFVMHIIVSLEVAKVFGQGTGFALGLIFLPVVFYPILAFGSATYMGRAGQPGMPGQQAPGYGY